jgi:hypothetical protein
VGELRVEHVEAKLARARNVATRRDELEGRLRVDEAPDQPGARDAVDVYAFPRDPGAPPDVGDGLPPRRGRSPGTGGRRTLLEPVDEPLDGHAPGRREEVDLGDVPEALPKARDRSLDLAADVVRRVAGAWRQRRLRERPDLRPELAVVGLARVGEEPMDLVVGEAVDQPRLAERCVPTLASDLPEDPFEVLAGVVGIGKDVDRVLDRDGPHRLEAPPDLHPEIRRLRRELMDQQQPRARRRLGHELPDRTAESSVQHLLHPTRGSRTDSKRCPPRSKRSSVRANAAYGVSATG